MNSQVLTSYPRLHFHGLAFALVALLSAHPGLAQTVAPAPKEATAPVSATVPVARPAPLAAEEEVYELSPFQVTAEEDTGYQATSTLGGTRLRTDLKDLAASISVVTKEMMDDLAVDDLSKLANYTLGTEVAGSLDGNYSGARAGNGFTSFDSVLSQVQPPVRLRGLDTASRTRDYFLTDLPEDRYNMDRVEVQRGPNGMLYGLGSPAGVVNSVMAKANVQRNHTTIGTRFDNHGSYRGSLDYNHVLIRDKLAVRLDTVYNRSKYQIEEAEYLDRRGYGTLTYKPFQDTTVRVSGETARLWGTPPQLRPPNDAFTYWWDVGQPVFNALTNTFSFSGTAPAVGGGINGNPNQFTSNGQHRAANPSLIVDALNGQYGITTNGGFTEAAVLASNRLYRNAANTAWINGQIRSTARGETYLRATQTLGSFASNFFRLPQVFDPGIFDFFHHQLDGQGRTRGAKWGTYNVALEQRLGRHAGLELAYDSQDLRTHAARYIGFNRYLINLDITSVLADGSPNPNFGRPFMADVPFVETVHSQRDAFRATAYYDLDFKRLLGEDTLLAKILGRHTFTGNFTRQTEDTYLAGGGPFLDESYYDIIQAQNAGTSTVANARSNGQRQVNIITYLGPSLIGTTGPQNQGITGLNGNFSPVTNDLASLNLYYHQIPPASSKIPTPYQVGRFDIIKGDVWDATPEAYLATRKRSVFRAVSLVGQDRWLNNSVVTTWGWRRDWIKTYDAGSPPDDGHGNLLTDDANFPLQPVLDQRHDAFNWGVVVHAPDFIARHLPEGTDVGLLFNRSDNFTPQTARYSVYGDQIDPTTGTTKDYGFYVSLFHRKLDLRVSHYKSASTLATNTSLNSTILSFDRDFYRTMLAINGGTLYTKADGVTDQTAAVNAFVDFLRSPVAAPFYRPEVAGWYVDASGNLQGSTDGTVLRVLGTSDVDASGWEYELTANPTKNWRITANVAKQTPVLSNSGTDLWNLMATWRPFLAEGPIADLERLDGNTATIGQLFETNESSLRRIRALDGSLNPEVRKWRFNLISNYSFSTGRLKGWAVGGSFRWQDKSAIGYPVIQIDGVGQYDVHNPYYGPAERNYGAWLSYSRRLWHDKVRWKAQLNVSNIGQHNKLIPATAQPDGSIDAYRIAADASWTLSNTFEF